MSVIWRKLHVFFASPKYPISCMCIAIAYVRLQYYEHLFPIKALQKHTVSNVASRVSVEIFQKIFFKNALSPFRDYLRCRFTRECDNNIVSTSYKYDSIIRVHSIRTIRILNMARWSQFQYFETLAAVKITL